MAEVPSSWSKTFKRLNIHKTTCNKQFDALKYMIEYRSVNSFKYDYRDIDGAIYTVGFRERSTDKLVVTHKHDIVYNFASAKKCKLALYIDNALIYEDCTNLPMEYGIHVSTLPFSEVKIIPEITTKISYQAIILDNKIIKDLDSQHYVTINKGTILKRLQNPEIPIGEYFTYQDADLDKCGVSRYYTSKYGFEEEKKVLKFIAKEDFTCERKTAVNAIDNWSSGVPCKCKGGEDILYIHFNSKLANYSVYLVQI